MSGINKAFILGNIGKPPELKYTKSGHPVCTFSVATSEKIKDQEVTEWHSVQCWGKLAELCAQYLAKGSKVHVEGKIHNRSWEKDNVKHYRTEIVAQNVQFLTPKSDHELFQHGNVPAPSLDDSEELPF